MRLHGTQRGGWARSRGPRPVMWAPGDKDPQQLQSPQTGVRNRKSRFRLLGDARSQVAVPRPRGEAAWPGRSLAAGGAAARRGPVPVPPSPSGRATATAEVLALVLGRPFLLLKRMSLPKSTDGNVTFFSEMKHNFLSK